MERSASTANHAHASALSTGEFDRLGEQEVMRLRGDTPGCAERIHLNNAGAGLMPRAVSDAVHAHLDLESHIGGYEAASERQEDILGAYRAVADLIGCRTRNVAFVENATVAYAQALSAIPFRPGDKILTTSNDYVSNQIMFLSLARRIGVEVRRVPDAASGEVDVDAVREGIRRDRPRVVAITHVPTNSGLVQPISAIGDICTEAGTYYLVDACQSVGQLAVDVREIRCDFLSATSRKFLRGPRGAGFLFASDRALEDGLAPLFLDMQGAEWIEADRYATVPTAARFENWEFAYALVLGSGAAASYAHNLGLERIAERVTKLAERVRERLTASGLRVLDRGSERCAIATVAIPAWDGPALHQALLDRKINTSISERIYATIDFDAKDVAWALRISPHYYNTEEEIDAAVASIAELAASTGR